MIVPKAGSAGAHNWKKTERKIPGGILKLYACTAHKPAHVKVYDMETTDPSAFKGHWEYEERNKRHASA